MRISISLGGELVSEALAVAVGMCATPYRFYVFICRLHVDVSIWLPAAVLFSMGGFLAVCVFCIAPA